MFLILQINNLKKITIKVLEGIIIGASMMIPGFSGGTAAILLGVFQKILKSASELLADFNKNFKFLLPYGIGGIFGVYLVF